jgi:hypothetical protein
VRTGGVTTLYVNGSPAGSNAAGTTPYNNGSGIGSQYTGGSNHGFTGDIDEVYFSTVSGFNALTDLHMAAPADPLIVMPPAAQDAGTLVVATTTDFDVSIGNSGASNTLTIASVTGLTGDTGKFSLQTTLPLGIPPGGSGKLTFRYAPGAAAASHSATFAISNNTSYNPGPNITLTGSAIADPNLVPPSILNFGNVIATAGGITLPLVVSNSGTKGDLTPGAAVVSGDTPYFTASLLPGPLLPGAAEELRITYNPLGNLGTHSAVLEITHNDPDVASPIQVTLTGTSIPPISINQINMSGNICTVNFTGPVGQTYVLKKSLTLIDGFPIEVGRITLTAGPTGTLQDTAATEPKAFYRLETTNTP